MSNEVKESKITYRQVGDYQIPYLILSPEETKFKLGLGGKTMCHTLFNGYRIIIKSFYFSANS